MFASTRGRHIFPERSGRNRSGSRRILARSSVLCVLRADEREKQIERMPPGCGHLPPQGSTALPFQMFCRLTLRRRSPWVSSSRCPTSGRPSKVNTVYLPKVYKGTGRCRRCNTCLSLKFYSPCEDSMKAAGEFFTATEV